MPGAATTNLDSELNIVIQFGEILITHADLLRFEYSNAINTVPSGQFTLIDKNSDFVKAKSGDFGRIIFTNTTDVATDKFSSIEFIVDDIIQEDVVAANSVYRLMWSAGNKAQLKKKTRSFSGNSVDAMAEVFNIMEIENNPYPSDASKPTDRMVWRNIQENMWDQLDTIVSKSFLKNDYLFWAWDDVNNKFKISSLGLEKEYEDRFILTQSSESVTSTSAGKAFLDNPNFTIWQYDKQKTMNDLGKHREKLFPNVSFSGIRGSKLLTAGVKQASFSELLTEMGDIKQNEVMEASGLDDKTDTFGNLKIKRHWPNNTHNLYSFADIYRNYKISTYAKIIMVQTYNNVGPALGSKVSVIKMGDDYRIRGLSLDVDFSDAFIVQEKLISYNPVTDLSPTGPKNVNLEFVTTLKLVSDNFAGTGEEHIAKIFKQLLEKSNA